MGSWRSRLGKVRRSAAGMMVLLVAGILPAGAVIAAGDEPVKVTWFVGLGAPQDGEKARKKELNSVVKAFNKSHSDIKVVLDVEGGDVHEALGTALASGALPDLMGPMPLRELAFSDSFADLTPLAAAASFDLSAYEPGLLDAYRVDGDSLVGLPYGAYPSVLYYNTQLFDEAGLAYPPLSVDVPYVMPGGTERTWDLDAIVEIAKLLTIDANGNDATSADFDPTSITQFGFHDQGDMRRTLTTLAGAESMVADDGSGRVDVIFPEPWRAAVQWYHDAVWRDHFMPTATQIASPLLAGGNPFGSGNVAMVVAPLWYTCCLVDGTGAPMQDWDLGIVPAGLTGVTTSPLHSDVLAISGTSANPAEAFEVLRYLIDDPRAASLWPVAPAATAKRADWYAGVNSIYPDVANWAAADVMLDFPDIPSHQADVPSLTEVEARLNAFRGLLLSDAGEGIDVDAELDKLAADLTSIAGQ